MALWGDEFYEIIKDNVKVFLFLRNGTSSNVIDSTGRVDGALK